MQRIIIRNFGPIPECDIELKNFTIFIGEQATGKSTICKSVYFFKLIRDELKTYLVDVLDNGQDENKVFYKVLNRDLKTRFVELFGQSKFRDDFKLEFHYDIKKTVSVGLSSDGNKYLDITFSKPLTNEIKDLQSLVYQAGIRIKDQNFPSDTMMHVERNKYLLVINSESNKIFCDSRALYYVPAGRGIFTLLTNQQLSIVPEQLDFTTRNFMKMIEKERNNFDGSMDELIRMSNYVSDENKQRYKYLKAEMKKVLKGEYEYSKGKEYVRLIRRQLLPINFVSSGQQEVLWILNLSFIWMVYAMTRGLEVFVIIEEPEAHLYPEAQKNVVEILAMLVNAANNQLLITTHSPYILTAANNLQYAGRVSQNAPDKAYKIVSKDRQLDPKQFSAYKVGSPDEKTQESYVRSIIDDELHEVAAEEIDGVSQQIRSIYSKLFELES